MKSIKFTVPHTGLEFLHPLYFADLKDMEETERELLRHIPCEEDGVFKITVSEGRIYYTDTITRAAHRVILDHVRLWKEAEKLAELKLGSWACIMENKALRRAATARQLAAAKEQMISEVIV